MQQSSYVTPDELQTSLSGLEEEAFSDLKDAFCTMLQAENLLREVFKTTAIYGGFVPAMTREQLLSYYVSSRPGVVAAIEPWLAARLGLRQQADREEARLAEVLALQQRTTKAAELSAREATASRQAAERSAGAAETANRKSDRSRVWAIASFMAATASALIAILSWACPTQLERPPGDSTTSSDTSKASKQGSTSQSAE